VNEFTSKFEVSPLQKHYTIVHRVLYFVFSFLMEAGIQLCYWVFFYHYQLEAYIVNYAGGFIGSHSKKTSSSPFFGVEVFTIMSPI